MKLALSILIIIFFFVKDILVWRYFPNLRTDSGEWDGANLLTMDMYAAGLFLSYVLARSFSTNKKLNVLIDILIGVAGSDLFDRLVLHATTKSDHDMFTFWSTLAWVLIDYYLPELKQLYGRIRK